MKIIRPLEENNDPNTIYLLGSDLENKTNHSWREEALDILDDMQFDGSVAVPENIITPDNVSNLRNWMPTNEDLEWADVNLSIAIKTGCVAVWDTDFQHRFSHTSELQFGLFISRKRFYYGLDHAHSQVIFKLDQHKWHIYEKYCKRKPLRSIEDLMEVAMSEALRNDEEPKTYLGG